MYAEIAQKKSKVKNTINEFIVKEMSPLNISGRHMVLDSYTLGTTNVYTNRGISISNIHIPQIDCQEFLKIAEHNIKVNLYRCSANQLIHHFLIKRLLFQSIYLDYCCNATGNKKINPLEDLQQSLKLLYDNGILAWTFSTRTSIKQNRTYELIDKVRKKLDVFAKEHKYVLRHLFAFPYKSTLTNTSSVKKGHTMFVTAVRVEKSCSSIRR
jgi:hypothetical protein